MYFLECIRLNYYVCTKILIKLFSTKKTHEKDIILFAVTLLSTAAFAQTTWKTDRYHSKLGFTVTHLMVSDVDGVFKEFTAQLILRNLILAMPSFALRLMQLR